jgi:hypothetical protein
VIVLGIERKEHGDTEVTVVPVTHRPPAHRTVALEFPPAVQHALGLDDEHSWDFSMKAMNSSGRASTSAKCRRRVNFTMAFRPRDFSSSCGCAQSRARRRIIVGVEITVGSR